MEAPVNFMSEGEGDPLPVRNSRYVVYYEQPSAQAVETVRPSFDGLAARPSFDYEAVRAERLRAATGLPQVSMQTPQQRMTFSGTAPQRSIVGQMTPQELLRAQKEFGKDLYLEDICSGQLVRRTFSGTTGNVLLQEGPVQVAPSFNEENLLDEPSAPSSSPASASRRSRRAAPEQLEIETDGVDPREMDTSASRSNRHAVESPSPWSDRGSDIGSLSSQSTGITHATSINTAKSSQASKRNSSSASQSIESSLRRILQEECKEVMNSPSHDASSGMRHRGRPSWDHP